MKPMKTKRLTEKSRAALSERFASFGSVDRFMPPMRGWIKAVREALGMTTAQLASRMQIKQQSITDLERSEMKGNVELATLRKAAVALNCTLIYALVPNQPLDETIRGRAREFARKHLAPIEHSMLIEDQKVTSIDDESRIDDIIRDTNPRRFWD
jgi:predicted DNA-binding mobile mystery protein A